MQIFSILTLSLMILFGAWSFLTAFRIDTVKRPFILSHQVIGVFSSLIILIAILNFIAYIAVYEKVFTPLVFFQYLGAGSLLFTFYSSLEWITNVIFVIIPLTLVSEIKPSFSIFFLFLKPSSFSLPVFMGCISFAAYLGFQSKSYSIYGVTSKSLLPAVGTVLTKLNQDYEQKEMVGFYIKSLKSTLIVKLDDDSKIVSLKFKWNSFQKVELLNQIIHELKDYYQDEDSELTTKALVSFLVGGAIALIYGIFGYFMLTHLNGQLNP